MSLPASDDADITYALVCLKTGVLLDACEAGAAPPSARLVDLAAAAPELFRAGTSSDFGALFTSLGSEQSAGTFQEFVFVSAQGAHVVQRLPSHPDTALVALSPEMHKLGIMLSGVRARMLSLEAQA